MAQVTDLRHGGNIATLNRLPIAVPEKTWYVLFAKPHAEK
jgi:hypothetical protein